MRGMLALVLHLGGVGECVRLIREWSFHNQESGDLQDVCWGEVFRRSRGIRNTSCHISFEFLFIISCPPDKLHNGFGFVVQFRIGICHVICQGASFDKKEFKKNVAGSVSYAPASTVVQSAIHPIVRPAQ